MRKFPSAVALLFTLALSIHARATTFTLTNVELAGGGMLTGSFVADSSYSLYSTNIAASTNNGYLGFDYTLSDTNTIANYLPTYIDLSLSDQNGYFDRLRLNFQNFTVNGGSIATTSYEEEISGGSRYVISGLITSDAPPRVSITPEPSSVVLLGIGALGILCAARRKIGVAI